MAATGRGDRKCEGLEKDNAKSSRRLVYVEEGRGEYGEERVGVGASSGRPQLQELSIVCGDT